MDREPMDKKRDKISVVIATYNNDEDEIRNYFKHIKWTDETVIFDDLSTDRTAEICKEYTDKIILHKLSDFYIKRNMSIGNSTSDWILAIDVNMIVTDKLKEEIENFL